MIVWAAATDKLRRTLRRWRVNSQKPLGQLGEVAAAKYLRKQRYTIIARGHRDQLGELDLIAVDGRTVVFVEVKTRRSHDMGHPAESVNQRKQQQLTRLALAYLKRHDLLNCRARFDVIAVTWSARERKPHVEHIKNAFPPVGSWQMFS